MSSTARISRSTGKLTANTLIKNGRGALTGVQILTNGASNATVTIYDNTTNNGKIIFEQVVIGANRYGGRDFRWPVEFENGAYLEISGTGAECIVERLKGRFL